MSESSGVKFDQAVMTHQTIYGRLGGAAKREERFKQKLEVA